MKEIKFKYNFLKLPPGINGKEAKLISISNYKYDELDYDLINYDSVYYDIFGNQLFYKFNKYQNYLLLVFIYNNQLFTSLRKACIDNIYYYTIGEYYKILISGT